MDMFGEAGAALVKGGWAVVPLLVMAIAATALILDKLLLYARAVRTPADLLARVADPAADHEDLERAIAALGPRHLVGGFLAAILAHRERPTWWIESRAGDAARRVEDALGRGLWVLETVVTAAPLLGLLGTIIGMMRSFRLMGDSGPFDPAGVTAGVAEALIATALGLLVALVALFGFNWLARLQARTMDGLERLGTALVDRLRLAAEEAARPSAGRPGGSVTASAGR